MAPKSGFQVPGDSEEGPSCHRGCSCFFEPSGTGEKGNPDTGGPDRPVPVIGNRYHHASQECHESRGDSLIIPGFPLEQILRSQIVHFRHEGKPDLLAFS